VIYDSYLNIVNYLFNYLGKSDKFIEDFAALQPVIDCKRIYENFYKDKMEELTERIAREKLIHEQKEKGNLGFMMVFTVIKRKTLVLRMESGLN
jgi:hypothetical protein